MVFYYARLLGWDREPIPGAYPIGEIQLSIPAVSSAAKIWMTPNHEPVIPETDYGIWRRIWMVPFSVQIPEEKCDPEIAAKLLAESSGILNWCLAGLKQYYVNGSRLVQPRKVSQATANLRTVSDTVGLFLAGSVRSKPGLCCRGLHSGRCSRSGAVRRGSGECPLGRTLRRR